MPINLQQKLLLLNSIYTLYDEVIQPWDLACGRFCADCCTCNLTLTTLEGYRILSSLESALKKKLLAVIHAAAGKQRFQPRLTFNQIAGLCLNGKDVPDEFMDSNWGACPVLAHQACPIYLDRPFGCRCMVSRVRCGETGYADIDDLLLSVNNLFLQHIEHIDTPGLTGNFMDVLCFLESESNQDAYRAGTIFGNPKHLIFNSPIPVIMIPPKHRERILPVLRSLRKLLSSYAATPARVFQNNFPIP